MLPPIPASLVPVTPQHDVVKPRPEIPPVTPAQASSDESAVALDKRHPQDSVEWLAEEQRRRQRERHAVPGETESAPDWEADEASAAEPEEPSRLGSHVDISV